MGKPTVTMTTTINKKDVGADLIYLVTDGDCIKNGITRGEKGFRGRLNNLRCGNPKPITAIAVMHCEHAAFAEAIFAFLAHDYLVRGSWYQIQRDMAEVLLDRAIALAYNGIMEDNTSLSWSFTYNKASSEEED